MGIFKPLLPALFVIAFISGCGDIETATDDGSGDKIKITSITPLTAVAGTSTDFTVNVAYTLASDDGGVLDIGFNTVVADQFHVLETYSHQVSKGTGTYTFKVTGVVPVDYSTDPFMVEVYLSEYPHDYTSWKPYAGNTAAIELTSSAGKASPEISNSPAPGNSSIICYKAEGVDDFCVRYE